MPTLNVYVSDKHYSQIQAAIPEDWRGQIGVSLVVGKMVSLLDVAKGRDLLIRAIKLAIA